MSFPSNPAPNQEHIAGGKKYVFNNGRWSPDIQKMWHLGRGFIAQYQKGSLGRATNNQWSTAFKIGNFTLKKKRQFSLWYTVYSNEGTFINPQFGQYEQSVKVLDGQSIFAQRGQNLGLGNTYGGTDTISSGWQVFRFNNNGNSDKSVSLSIQVKYRMDGVGTLPLSTDFILYDDGPI